MQLDENQTKAVEYDEPFKLIIPAGPGAGKTRVLIERVKFLLKNGAKPESFLIVTFTNEAVKELKERLSNSEDGIDIHDVNKMQISTIHGFCSELLREAGKSGFNILDDDVNERKNMFMRRYRDELGLKREAYISGYGLNKVIKVFDEYSSFDVDTPAFTEYIKENFPISQEYMDLINDCGEGDDFSYPYEDVNSGSDELKIAAANAKYLKVAEAYPKYCELLEENNYLDYNLLQRKALDLLDKNPDIAINTRFKNILIDEFQDTDPIQMKIFKHFMDDFESFTIVGDDDQCIYGFRGSVPEYFTNFIRKYGGDEEILKYNYRSGKKIVKFNEKFIEPYRKIDKKLESKKTFKSEVCSLSYKNQKEEAENISNLIKYLKDNNKILKYSDVGILFHSIKYLTDLLVELDKNKIPFNLDVSEKIIDADEVRAIITLFWYLKSKEGKYVPTLWERYWLNLTSFDNPYFNLSKETIKTLKNIELDYQEKALQYAKEVFEENNEDSSKLTSYKEIFKTKHGLRNQIFETVGKPKDISVLTLDELQKIGITDENDLKLFEYLNNLKMELTSSNKGKPTLLDLYYMLIEKLGMVNNRFENENEENTKILLNLAMLSQTIANYEEIVYKHDLNGLFWYMSSNLDSRTTPLIKEKEDAVEIMTIHSSKGREFEVVIVGNVGKRFDMDIDKELENEIKVYDDKYNPLYPTPIEYLDFKEGTRKDELERELLERKHELYVAMTRAKRLLVLSNSSLTRYRSEEIDRMKKTLPSFKDLTPEEYGNIPELYDKENIGKEDIPKEELIDLSYTSFSDYRQCPHDYNVKYNYGFRNTPNEYILMGTIAHGIVDQIHQKHISGQEITDGLIDEIFNKTENYNRNIDPEDKEYQLVKEAIHKYWKNDGSKWNILASEYEFHVIKKGYNLKGKIDLIISNGKEITVVDFKTTQKPIKPTDERKYLEQLSIYAIALREDPQYEDYNIQKGMIYTIKNNQQYHFDLTDEIINNMEEEITDTVNKIKNHEFPRCNKANCQSCNRFKTVISYEDAIKQVKSQLNGEREHDRMIIRQAMDEYDESPYAQEIIHELSEMFTSYLTQEEIDRFDKALGKDLPEYALLNSVEDDMNNQRFDEAYEKLDAYMKDDTRSFVPDDTIEYHVLDNDFEETLFEKYVEVKKELRTIPFKLPIHKLYYYYAFLLVEQNRLEEAEKALKMAREYNPISPILIFELIDLYKKTKDWDNMNKYIELAFKYAYDPEFMSRIYRDLGYYYVEIEKLELAAASYIYSFKYAQTQQAYQELEYIKHLGQNIEITMEEAKKILEENNVQLVANPFIVKEYRDSGDKFAEKEDLENALQMYGLAYMLDDSMENQMRYKMAEAAVNGEDHVNISL